MLTFHRTQRSWRTSLGAPRAGRTVRDIASRLGKLALLVPLAALVVGCSATGDVDNTDNNVILNIEDMQLVSDPFGDVLTIGGVILDDTISVDFSAVLKAPITTNPTVTQPDLQSIALDRYEVTFTRTDGGTSVPAGFQRGIAGLVRLTEPQAEEVVVLTVSNIVIVPSTTKSQPPISYLISPGIETGTNFTNIQVNARIEFFGHTLAGDPVSVVGNLGINLANYGDDNQ
ncbi:MAG: hypothetical protein PVJ49_04205 [Acidobacteriota bacterium]|jgi:hypothetical protein